ncbi:desulfoferrodoxin [Sedimentibacter sp. zth1]|uniref:desulfoferrodoxin family protein n=1 Tax=Sedimentibacter sp. zth1 TaxID=2816908 RepID=UPI001A91E70F|nr:desulfoferrodoxin family protein [Sedimentibacter sp. zth1]QSX07085.1 desulfoferrodoxin [Sedimentibacter sp. zth1]
MVRKENKFYSCDHCGNIMRMIRDEGVPIVCCGETMREMVPNIEDASHEKHIPEIDFNRNTLRVKIGNIPHPMVKEHSIKWVFIVSQEGEQLKYLRINKAPEVEFSLVNGDKPIKVYAYCNIHGLWEVEV